MFLAIDKTIRVPSIVLHFGWYKIQFFYKLVPHFRVRWTPVKVEPPKNIDVTQPPPAKDVKILYR